MSNANKTTPRPWSVATNSAGFIYITNGTGWLAIMGTEESAEKDAELIVTAVNERDELLKQLTAFEAADLETAESPLSLYAERSVLRERIELLEREVGHLRTVMQGSPRRTARSPTADVPWSSEAPE